MRRRQVQRNVRSSVLGTVADSVEVRVLLSADPAMAAVDVVSGDAVSEEQPAAEQNLAVGEPEFDAVDIRISTDPVICDQPVAFQPDGSFGEADVNEADRTVFGDDKQAIAECGVLLQPEQLSFEPQVITCEPYNLTDESQQPFLLGLSENFEFGGAAESGFVDVAAFGGAGRFAQFYNPVASISGSVTAEIELASAAEYDQDGNLIAPAVLLDRLSGIRYWQPKQFTLQSASDLTEVLQNYGVSDYSVDEQGAWVIPVSPQDSVATLNTVMQLQLAFTLQTNDTVQAQVVLQPVDGQDAVSLLIKLPDSQITVNYESASTDPVWSDGWQNSSVQIQAGGAFNGTLEVSEGPQWDDAGQLISAGVLVDLATGLRYQSPVLLTVSGEAIEQLDLLLQDSQWAAGLDTKIVSVDAPDAQTRLLQISPGTGYDALQLAGRLTEQTGLACAVRLESVDEGGEALQISTPDTVLFVNYPVYMYSRGSINVESPELQFGEVLTAGSDGPVGPEVLQTFDNVVKLADGADVPMFAFGGAVAFGGGGGRTSARSSVAAERAVVREAISQMWTARARQPELVREAGNLAAADNTLSRVSGIAAALPISVGRTVPPADTELPGRENTSAVQFSGLNFTTEVQVQSTESVPDLELLNPELRRRQPRPVPEQSPQGDEPVGIPVEQPAVPAPPQRENSAAQLPSAEIPVSRAETAIDSLMAAFAAAGVTH